MLPKLEMLRWHVDCDAECSFSWIFYHVAISESSLEILSPPSSNGPVKVSSSKATEENPAAICGSFSVFLDSTLYC